MPERVVRDKLILHDVEPPHTSTQVNHISRAGMLHKPPSGADLALDAEVHAPARPLSTIFQIVNPIGNRLILNMAT